MANLNKVILIGRLTRDPETRALASGAKVAKFGLAVNNPRRNQQTGEWEDNPVFVDVDVWNQGQGTNADRAELMLRKGMQIFVEGRLKLDQWTAQDGQKRSKLFVVAERFQSLEPRAEGGGMGGGQARPQPNAYAARKPAEPAHVGEPDSEPPYESDSFEPTGGKSDDPPF